MNPPIAHDRLRFNCRNVCSSSFAAGVAVWQKRPVEDWLDHIAERVLHYAISERQRRNLAALWFVYKE